MPNLTEFDLDLFKKQGYLIRRQFFPKKMIEKVLADAKRVFISQFIHKELIRDHQAQSLSEPDFNELLYQLFDEDLTTLSNCGKQIQHLFSLHELSLDGRIQELLLQLGLVFPNISTRPVMYFNHKRLAQKRVFYKVDAHQDWRSMQGSLNSVVVWIPLIDVDKQLGALEVIPGSHLNGLKTSHLDSGFGMVQIDETDKFTSVELHRGDILVFSSFLIHQSGENVTGSPRWSCHFRYNDLAEKSFINRKYAHPYVYKPQEELLTPGFPTLEALRDAFS